MKHRALSTQHTVPRGWSCVVLSAVCCLLSAGVMGCESLQRKFIRKPKTPHARPSPIVVFQDYTRAMTPLDRYRKHAMMFDYWNDQLLGALRDATPNPKRIARASTEALAELQTMKDLLVDEVGARLTPLVEERTKLHRQLQSPAFTTSQAGGVARVLEFQMRQIHREFFWRDVQDSLKNQ